MTTKRSFAAITSAAAVAIFGSVAAASEAQPVAGFDWMANGAQTVAGADRLEEARVAVRKARELNANATWVCSPAGFGKRSHCERG